MKVAKIKIISSQPLSEGLDVPVDGCSFHVGNDKITIYRIVQEEIDENDLALNDPITSLLQEEERNKIQAEFEFKRKYQIKTGNYLLNSKEEGWSQLPAVDERFFETETSKYLSSIFSSFFAKSEDLFLKYKKNKRAYLLYSEPGMGKSALIRYFSRQALSQEGTAVLQVPGDIDFSVLTNIFLKEYAVDVKRIVLIIEDFGKRDYANNSNIYNPSCLNFLDGVSGVFKVPTLVLCTTNYIQQLGNQLTNRPGRFNRIIEVLPPSDEEVFQLIKELAGIELTEDQKQAFLGKKMTPDHVIECLLRHEFENMSLEEAAYSVMQERANINS